MHQDEISDPSGMWLTRQAVTHQPQHSVSQHPPLRFIESIRQHWGPGQGAAGGEQSGGKTEGSFPVWLSGHNAAIMFLCFKYSVMGLGL